MTSVTTSVTTQVKAEASPQAGGNNRVVTEMAQAMVKESRDLITDTNKTTAANTEIMGRAVRLLEDRRSETRLLEDRR